METQIGDYDATTRSVPVTFIVGEIVHERSVNACFDSHGDYDVLATRDRVDAVARGVKVKIGLGVIRKAEPEPELPEVQDEAPAE